jgi:HlyD family secretion protein
VRARTILIAFVVVVVVGGIATAAIAFTSSDPHAYRTATATTGNVTRELHGTGVIEPVSQATVAFPIAGTVKSVNVKLGGEVATGTTLATLDTTSLESQVLSKRATLASAQLNLYKALHGESVTGGGGTGGNGGNGRTPTTNAVTTAAEFNNVSDAAQAVATAQHAVDGAMAAVNDALAAADTACGQKPETQPRHGGSSGGSGGTGHHGPPASTPPTSVKPPTTTTTTTPANGTAPSTGIGSAACQAAQQSLFAAQEDLAQKQQTLGQAENAYGEALRSSSAGNGQNGGNGNANRGLNGASGSNNSNSVTYSADDLVSYQAVVDAATAEVAAAQESVAQATIDSPISGTVVALSLYTGQQVTAGSSTADVVIAGSTGYEIATSIGVNDITQVKVGDTAAVVPDGSLERINGKVVFVGSPATTNTSTTYPVIIGLGGAPASLRNGAMATTTIDVATSQTDAVLVPTSAVHNLNGRHTVSVLKDGKTTTVAVEIGVVGAQKTEITSGIDAGQTVVLADVGAAVPSSNADSRIASQFGSGLTGGGSGGNARISRGG